MKTDALANVATMALAACALIVTALVVRREFSASPGASSFEVRTIRDWRAYAARGHRSGPRNAPVTIVEFEDYQCPFCRRMVDRLDSLQRADPLRIAVVRRHFPLDAHAQARAAALAAECAGDQGAFEAYERRLYASQDSLGPAKWVALARDAGVPDLPRFAGCVGEAALAGNVDRDVEAGRRLGITGTPTFLVNHLMVRGEQPGAVLGELVRKAGR